MALPPDHQQQVFSDNLYERLGLAAAATTAQIESAYSERRTYWFSLQPNHPKYGRNLDKIRSRVEEAYRILADPAKRKKYDQELKQQQKQASEEELKNRIMLLTLIIDAALADHVLVPAERQNIYQRGAELEIPADVIQALIEEKLEETDSVYLDSDAATPTTGGGRPKLKVEGVPDRKVVFTHIPLNHTASHEITIDNVGGGVNEGTISTTENWLSVSAAKLDTRIHRQSLSIRVNTRGLKLAGRYTGRVKIQSRGGSETILVDLSVEGAEKHAQKLTRIATILALCLGLAVWGLLAYTSGTYRFYQFYIVAAAVLVFGLSLVSLAREHAGYFWLFVALITLGAFDFFSMMLFLPALLTLWFSRPFFRKFPIQSAWTVILPVLLCSAGWTAGYWGSQHPEFFKDLPTWFNKKNSPKTASVQPAYATATVQAPQGASLRSGPGVSHARIGVLPHGMPVKILKREQGWCQIMYGEDGRTGFIYQTLLNESSTLFGTRSTPVSIDDQNEAPKSVVPDAEIQYPVRITSDPPAADLLIYGKLIGKTPLVHKITAGLCEIQLTKSGFQDVSERIRIEADGSREFNFRLEADAGEPPTAIGNGASTDSGTDIASASYDVAPKPIGGYAAIQAELKYPDLARQQGIEGRVLVHVQINQSGAVIGTKVLKSLGKNGCDEAAIEAIRQVRWEPALSNNEPVTVWVVVPVIFKLN